MTIEQTLMRMMKTRGGVTRGRGYTDSVLAKFTLGMPVMHSVSEAIERFTGVLSSSTEQHVDLRPSRISKDNKDSEKLRKWLSEHPPFPDLDKIVSLGTGIVGGADINCHNALEVGTAGMKDIVGKTFAELSFSRKKRVMPLSTVSSSIKINDIVVPIDPALLYQRISFVKESQDDLRKYLEYELAPYPLSLFDEYGMRKSSKSTLYSLFSHVTDTVMTEVTSSDVCYVIDGGFLLHKVVWKKGETFLSISERYVQYIETHYRHLVIVFDGYPENISKMSTKTADRLRRSTQSISADVLFEETMAITVSQQKFLSNERNKSRLIETLKDVSTERFSG